MVLKSEVLQLVQIWLLLQLQQLKWQEQTPLDKVLSLKQLQLPVEFKTIPEWQLRHLDEEEQVKQEDGHFPATD